MVFIKRSTAVKIIVLSAFIIGSIISFVLAINEELPKWTLSSYYGGALTDGPSSIYRYLLYFGDGSILMLAAALPALFGDSEFKHKKAFPLAITTIVGCFLSEALRSFVGICFPENLGVKTQIGISMPCPPVMNSAVFCFALVIILYRYMAKSKLKPLALSLISAAPLIAAVGAFGSGFFEITDITAGLCLGGALATVMSLVTAKGVIRNE